MNYQSYYYFFSVSKQGKFIFRTDKVDNPYEAEKQFVLLSEKFTSSEGYRVEAIRTPNLYQSTTVWSDFK